MCDDNSCKMQVIDSQVNNFRIKGLILTDEIGQNRAKPYFGSEIYFGVQNDKYIYELHISYVPGAVNFSNFFRQKLIDKIFSTILVKAK